jgi:hypothetical protein
LDPCLCLKFLTDHEIVNVRAQSVFSNQKFFIAPMTKDDLHDIYSKHIDG